MTSSSRAIRRASACARVGEVGVQAGRGGDHLAADAVTLDRLDHGVRRRLAARAARHEGRQLAPERHALLGQQAYAGRSGRLERRRAVVRASDEPDALAVVAAARGLQDAREAEVDHVGDRPDDAEPRQRGADAGQRLAHHDLVLGVDQRVRARAAPPCPSAARACRWSVGTCSWSKVTTWQPSTSVLERGEVGVVAHDVVGDHLGRGDAGRLGQEAQRDPQRGGRLGHHPGQLSASDDGDDRCVRVGEGHPRQRRRCRAVPGYGVRPRPPRSARTAPG